MSSAPPPAPPAPGEPKKSNAFMFMVIGAVLLFGCVFCGGIGAALLMPVLMKARQQAIMTKAKNELRQVALAEETFKDDDADKNGKRDYATSIEALNKAGVLDGSIARADDPDYVYSIQLIDGEKFIATATPRPGLRGLKKLTVDHRTAIREVEPGQESEGR